MKSKAYIRVQDVDEVLRGSNFILFLCAMFMVGKFVALIGSEISAKIFLYEMFGVVGPFLLLNIVFYIVLSLQSQEERKKIINSAQK